MVKQNVVYTYNGILFSLKRKEILPSAATWRTDLENFILSQRKTIMIPLTREICKIIQMNLYTKQTDCQTWKTNFGYRSRKRRGDKLGEQD